MVQPAIVTVDVVIQTDNELTSALYVLKVENSKLKSQVAELAKKKKRSRQCSVCYGRNHSKGPCTKRVRVKEVPCLLESNIQGVTTNHNNRGTDNGKVTNKDVCMMKRNFVPLQVRQWAQIRVLTASDDIQLSKEEYMIVRTPTMAEGRYTLRKKGDYGPYIHVMES